MTIQAIVFDFGNVLAHFDHRRAFEPLTSDTTLSVDEMLGLILGNEFEDDFDCGTISEDAFLEEMKMRCELRCDVERIRDCLEEIFWPNESLCNLIPTLAKSLPIHLLSNTNIIHSRRFRRDYASTLQHFSKLFLSHDMGTMKPRPEIFEQVQQQIGLPSKSLLFVDDLKANVEAAKACGWNGIVYTGTETLQQELKEHGIITPAGGIQ